MKREITIKMFFDIDEELVAADLLDITPKDRVEEIIKDQLTNIYCDDIGFEHIEVECRDYLEGMNDNII